MPKITKNSDEELEFKPKVEYSSEVKGSYLVSK